MSLKDFIIYFSPDITVFMPIPTAVSPTPSPIIDTLNNAIEPATANNDFDIGPSNNAAPAIIAIPPATDTRLFIKFSQLIVLISFNVAANKPIDTVAVANAAEPFRVPFIALKPTAKITIEPPNTVIALPIPFQLILLKPSKQPLICFMARAIAVIPIAFFIIWLSFGIILQATANSNNTKPNEAKPFIIPL